MIKAIWLFIYGYFVDWRSKEYADKHGCTFYDCQVFYNWPDFWWKLKNIWFWNVGFNFRPLSKWKSSGLVVFWLEGGREGGITVHLLPSKKDGWEWGKFESWYDGPILDYKFGPLCSINFLWF